MKKKKMYRKLLIILVLGYLIFTLINQQKVLNQYTENSKELGTKIEEQQVYNNELVAKKENVDSKEFIEQMAREKLEMYYPNENIDNPLSVTEIEVNTNLIIKGTGVAKDSL